MHSNDLWRECSKLDLNDGMFNDAVTVPWPGYIENKEHPFGYNNVIYPIKNSNKWCNTDDERSFLNNKKVMPADWRYLTKDVEYVCNQSGYRTYEWKDINWKDAIVIFGDSCTFGVGLAADETIDYFLEKLTGKQVINLGVPGGSNSLMLNMSTDLISRFGDPYAVIMNWSTSDRFRFYYKNGYHDCGPWDSELSNTEKIIDSVDITKLWELTSLSRHHEACTNYYIGKVAKNLWKDRSKYVSISYFSYTAHLVRAEEFFRIDNDARDRLHPGHRCSQKVAVYIANRLKEL